TGSSGGDCASGNFTPTTDSNYVPSDTWYYYCSYWGFWDSSNHGNSRPLGLSTQAPTFFNSTQPLNGVTFFFPFGKGGGINAVGNAGALVYAGAPNRCAGAPNGKSPAGSPSIPYPAGASNGVYSNPASS